MGETMGIEFIEYLFGGFIYWLSATFRERKKQEWANKGNMYKIYEVGMWVTIPLATLLLIVAVAASK